MFDEGSRGGGMMKGWDGIKMYWCIIRIVGGSKHSRSKKDGDCII